jgi:GNAT superfamily N-acetyltransferase
MDARLEALTESDFQALSQLATSIWRSHYTPIIGQAQVDYMLAGRYTPERLRLYLGASDRWMDLLKLDGALAGYCSYAYAPVAGEMKLEQLYLLQQHRGKGLGALMMHRVECQSRALGRSVLVLQVNKRNTASIEIYRKSGFVVREAAVFDIGGGFFMDDYVMAKSLAAAVLRAAPP